MKKIILFFILLYSSMSFSNNTIIGSFSSLRYSGVGVAHADIDNDGDIDIIVASTRNKRVKLLKNDGKGNFKESYIGIFESANDSKIAITVADVNGDKYTDIIIVASIVDNVEVIQNPGNW